jgi:hypothetical protein
MYFNLYVSRQQVGKHNIMDQWYQLYAVDRQMESGCQITFSICTELADAWIPQQMFI